MITVEITCTVSLKSKRARHLRAELVKELGSVCVSCQSTNKLHFDCIVPQGPAHHLMAWPERIRWYWQQHLLGNLQLLCPRCHLRKTQRDNRLRLHPVAVIW